MFKLRAITVTGADDSVDPAKLLDLGEKYPLAEFGILFGNHEVLDRFPSERWLDALRKTVASRGLRPRLSCHLCGKWAKEFLTHVAPTVPHSDLWQRIQVNTHGEPHQVVLSHLIFTLTRLQVRRGIEVIFQRDVQNDPIFDYVHRQVLTGARRYSVSTLFDLSHGAGVLPDAWPRPIDGARCGYAGGLSPANVSDQLDRIAEAVGNVTDSIWIDAETRLRSDEGSSFDLAKVEEFLARATLWEQRRTRDNRRPAQVTGLPKVGSTVYPPMPPVDDSDDDDEENRLWKKSDECCTVGDCVGVRESGSTTCADHRKASSEPAGEVKTETNVDRWIRSHAFMFQTSTALDLLADAVRNDIKDMVRATAADKAAIAELTAWKESAMDAAMAWNQVRELVAADPSVKPDSSIPIEAARIIRQHQKGSTS